MTRSPRLTRTCIQFESALQVQQSAELAALNAEADMPLEELLALYKRDAGPDTDSSDEDRMSVDNPTGDPSHHAFGCKGFAVQSLSSLLLYAVSAMQVWTRYFRVQCPVIESHAVEYSLILIASSCFRAVLT